MTRTSKLALFGFVVAAMAWSSSAQAQGMSVDANLAKRGKSLFQNRGCNACHTIGKGRTAGPDLLGVTERRSHAWLKRWLKDPTALFGNDATADSLLADAKGVKMPNLKLSDADIDALINYLTQESQAKKK